MHERGTECCLVSTMLYFNAVFRSIACCDRTCMKQSTAHLLATREKLGSDASNRQSARGQHGSRSETTRWKGRSQSSVSTTYSYSPTLLLTVLMPIDTQSTPVQQKQSCECGTASDVCRTAEVAQSVLRGRAIFRAWTSARDKAQGPKPSRTTGIVRNSLVSLLSLSDNAYTMSSVAYKQQQALDAFESQ